MYMCRFVYDSIYVPTMFNRLTSLMRQGTQTFRNWKGVDVSSCDSRNLANLAKCVKETTKSYPHDQRSHA